MLFAEVRELLPQAALDLGILGEFMQSVVDGAGGSLVAGDNKGDDVVQKLVLGKTVIDDLGADWIIY